MHFDWKIVDNRYSFDIFPNYFSKLTALKKGIQYYKLKSIESILKIGDSGEIDGNDYDFLQFKNIFLSGLFRII